MDLQKVFVAQGSESSHAQSVRVYDYTQRLLDMTLTDSTCC